MISDFLIKTFAFDDNSPLLFTQFYFWAFFAVVLSLLALCQKRILLRNAFLFFVSLFFYYKTSGLFTITLISATLISYLAGLYIGRAQGKCRRRIGLTIGIVANVSVLCYFKYAYFITDVINELLGTQFLVVDYFAMLGNTIFGSDIFRVDTILLPVGISFYTFQCISYIMDVYRQRIAPVSNFLNYGFYVSFFPQLVAGPIVRANEFMSQLYRPYNLSRRHFGMAIFWILNGLAKKIILSDYIAVNFVDRVFANPTMFTGFENLTALFGYSLQVYADFSGYTDIAIGVALIMGFYLPKNFNSPYKATNAANFWKRWHISLSKWLQDYLYIPMGGNRNATPATFIVIFTIAIVGTLLSGNIWVAISVMGLSAAVAIVALLVPRWQKTIIANINAMNTMLLGGLWHGASWNFMIWGGLNGLGMIMFKLWKPLNVYWRALIVAAVFATTYAISTTTQSPLINIALVWIGAITAATLLRLIYNLLQIKWQLTWLENVWAVAQTFVFITFTRLFFRSGSNLDPADANETAWNTAVSMVDKIGSQWNTDQILNIITEYKAVMALIVAGMIIHWLPSNFKRRYRLAFAHMPLPLMAILVALVIFVIYQFVTADLQKFIYFQF